MPVGLVSLSGKSGVRTSLAPVKTSAAFLAKYASFKESIAPEIVLPIPTTAPINSRTPGPLSYLGSLSAFSTSFLFLLTMLANRSFQLPRRLLPI